LNSSVSRLTSPRLADRVVRAQAHPAYPGNRFFAGRVALTPNFQRGGGWPHRRDLLQVLVDLPRPFFSPAVALAASVPVTYSPTLPSARC
jgi:hypothetical protein